MGTLDEFGQLTTRVLEYLPNIVTGSFTSKGYTVRIAESAGSKKYGRPTRDTLFVNDPSEFEKTFLRTRALLKQSVRENREYSPEDFETIDRSVYTMQQTVGLGLDFLSNPNSARKHTGNRFEEIVRLLVSEVGISNKKTVLKIPYGSGQTYSAETDLIFSPYDQVQSDSVEIDPREVVVSVKTSSKDRMGKIFIDKLLMERFVQHPVKVIGIFLNDVQRKADTGISYTFVSGLFMVYSEFLVRLDGAYWVDRPPITETPEYAPFTASFSTFLLRDIHTLIA